MEQDAGRGSFTLIPIPHVDIYEAVLAQLKGLIAQMEPGQRLPAERELAEQLGVSRVSLREALRSLESMGRIEIRRNAGSFVLDPAGNPITAQLKAVLPVDETFLNHLVQVRAALEDRVLHLVCAKEQDWSQLEGLLDQIEHTAVADGENSGSLDVRFEATLGRMSGNPLLLELQRSTHELWVDAWGSCGIAPGDRKGLHAEHREILAALQDGDEARSRALMAAHVDRQVG